MSDANSGSTRIAIVGGGVAGLATAVNLLDQAGRSQTDIAVTVFEKEEQPGGNLRTLRRDGWQLEWGPNGFLDNEPATLRLVERLLLGERLQRSSDATRRRFLLVDGRLQEIPTSPPAFIKSGMLPLAAKLRMAGELFVPGRKDLGQAADRPETDETIAEFGRRRLGKAFADTMLDPMVKGVFGGEATRLSLAAAFPRMVELESNYGGLFKAMIALSKEKKGKKKTDAGPTGTLHSFRGGMADLVDALAAVVRDDPRAELVSGAEVERIDRDGGVWTVTAGPGAMGPFDIVVDAAPAHAAARHLAGAHPEIAGLLQEIPFAPMAVVALGFDRGQVAHDLDGFGLLVPGKEKRDLLGALWTSSIFSGRAPEGKVLLRCMAGGAGNPAIMELGDDELTQVVCGELRPLLGLQGRPEMVNVIRHERAIAQYVPGHLARLKTIEERLAGLPGLYLTGSSYRGIAVNACVKQAEALAPKIISRLAPAAPAARTEAS
jgi:oxygen-dependent protoporphyrinogen oxidase